MSIRIVSQVSKMSYLSLPLLLALACGRSDETSSLAAVSPESLSGTWAKQFVLTSEASAAGTKSKNKVVRLSLVKLTSQGSTVSAEERVCEVGSLNSGATSIEFPVAILNAFETRRYSYTFDAAAQSLNLARNVEVLGAQLNDPFADRLPSSAGEASVRDQDQDGQAGVTVKVKAKVVISISAEIYVAQRTFWQESATVESENSIGGRVNWTQEQKTLGASNPLFTTISPTVTTLPKESSVSMKRLPASSDCETVKAQASALFPRLSI